MKRFVGISILVLCIALIGYPKTSIVPPPGVMIHESPRQSTPSDASTWSVGTYLISPLADYEIDARILLRKRYWIGKESSLSPLDLALAWGPMSDTKNVEKVTFSHSHRYYHYRITDPDLAVPTVAHHSANVHLIPANNDVYADLLQVKPGEFISMKGKLVEVRSADGFYWKSSLTRTDTGMGACELLWVEEVHYIDP